jgi:hypothetical protein
LDVRPGGSGHFPPAAATGSAVVSGNQSQPLEGLKFLQDSGGEDELGDLLNIH